MDKRLLAITSALLASATLCFGAGSPYITWLNGGGTNTFLTNAVIKTPLFRLNTNLGTVTSTISMPGTNTYANPLGKHIAIVNGSGVATSSDGAFGVFTRYKDLGVNLEIPSVSEQLAIVEVIDANNAIVAEGFGSALTLPSQSISTTTAWLMRGNVFESFDNTVGAENNGLRIDGNGGVWQPIAGDGGGMANAYYYSGLNGKATFSHGPVGASAVGLQGVESFGFAINSFRTNLVRVAQVYISPTAGSESLVLDNNGAVAIQYGIINRHGLTLPVGPTLLLTNSIATFGTNAPIAINTTGVTNTMGVNGTAFLTITNVAFTNVNWQGTAMWTNPVMNSVMAVPLPAGAAIRGPSGLGGKLIPW